VKPTGTIAFNYLLFLYFSLSRVKDRGNEMKGVREKENILCLDYLILWERERNKKKDIKFVRKNK
jgi:hypothetical protein